MSADDQDIDTGDVMSNGRGNAVTRFEAFGEKTLQKLRSEAVQMVANGAITVDDISLHGRTGDGVELVDGENEAFREDVREQLDDTVEDDATADEEAEQGEGWGPTEVDFSSIWGEYNFPEKVSGTQLVGALAVSEHTSFANGGARRAIQYGVEADRIIDIPRRLPDDSHGDEVVINGVMYALGGEGQ